MDLASNSSSLKILMNASYFHNKCTALVPLLGCICNKLKVRGYKSLAGTIASLFCHAENEGRSAVAVDPDELS